jgi:hypothetical protein
MPRFFSSLLLWLFFLAVSIQAQSDITRFQKQHRTNFNKKNLKSMQEMLVKSLESGNSSMVASATQTLRELLQIFPEESFSSLLDPLINIMMDENSTTSARILALFAIESLHSDAGDAAIKNLQNSTTTETLREICDAMFVPDIIAKEKTVEIEK